jgi:Leucine-rich repeat (LRR) protein
MKKIVVLLLLLLNISGYSFAQRAQDSLALVALYNSTNGANWTNKTNWLSSEPISNWFGITMGNNRITKLILQDNNLSGTIPEEIDNLIMLTMLELSNNNISGNIPSGIWNLTNLNFLYLYSNQLTGTISPQVGNLVNLKQLMLDGNQISGIIPPEVGRLTNLTALMLSSNHLSGIIPKEIGNLIHLTDLVLFSNVLSGSIPAEIGNLKALSVLSLSNNKLSGNIPKELGNLTNLINLHLQSNRLEGTIPPEIGNMSSLFWIYFDSNLLEGTIPEKIFDITGLVDLVVSGNKLTGEISQSINNFIRLERLWLFGNEFTGLPELKINSLNDCKFFYNHFTFEDLESNINIPNISYSPQEDIGQEQNLAGRLNKNITLSIICGGEHNLYQWKKNNINIPLANNPTYTIKKLKLSDAGSYTCAVTNSVVSGLTINSRPINLSIMLKGRDIDSLALVTVYNTTGGLNWTNNTNWLSSEPISDWHGVTVGINSGTKGLSDSTSVLRLDLSGNNLTGSIPPEIGTMTGLQSLNFGTNNLSGAVPVEINYIPSLQTLDLSDNKLDDLPELLFMSLDTLELGKNQFSFEDIEPNINVSGKEFDYLIQDSIGIKKDTICLEGTNIEFKVDDDALNNIYQWCKDGVSIPTGTSNTFIKTNLNTDDAGYYTCTITNSSVPGLTIYQRPVKLLVSSLTGVDDINNSVLKVYPNPSNGFLFIDLHQECSNSITLDICDFYGRIIFQKSLEGNQRHELDLSFIPKGLYFVRIQIKNKIHFQKVVIQ